MHCAPLRVNRIDQASRRTTADYHPRMEQSRWGTGPLLLLVGLLGLSGLASFAALGRLNTTPLYAEASAAVQSHAFTERRPVLLIVLDGLREDAARSMPTLQRIAHRGASARLVAGVPTFSAAGYVTLLTGTAPQASGRRTNLRLFPAALDSVPARLASEGRTARVLSDEVDWWRTLLPEAFSEVEVLPTAELLARAEAWMADFGPARHPPLRNRRGRSLRRRAFGGLSRRGPGGGRAGRETPRALGATEVW